MARSHTPSCAFPIEKRKIHAHNCTCLIAEFGMCRGWRRRRALGSRKKSPTGGRCAMWRIAQHSRVGRNSLRKEHPRGGRGLVVPPHLPPKAQQECATRARANPGFGCRIRTGFSAAFGPWEPNPNRIRPARRFLSGGGASISSSSDSSYSSGINIGGSTTAGPGGATRARSRCASGRGRT